MAQMVQNPYTGEFELDYSDGLPYEGDPFNPATGQAWAPDLLPQGVDPTAPWVNGNWNTGAAASTPGGDEPTTTLEDPLTPQPPPAAPVPGGTSGGSSPYAQSPSSITPSPDWPQFTAPALPTIAPFQGPNPYEYSPFAEPEPFSYGEFAAPSLEDAQKEPGYEFARTEGVRALMNANLGNLRNGGTLKNLIGWGDRFAEQNYGNVYNRAANTYTLNRGNAFDTFQSNRNNAFQSHQSNEMGKLGAWNTNFGADKDVFDRNSGVQLDLYDRDLRGKLAEFDPRFETYKLTFDDLYRRNRDVLDSLTRIGTAGAGA